MSSTSVTGEDPIDISVKAADDFSRLYYEAFDKRRHLIGSFYLSTSTLVWNGNLVEGSTNIALFLQRLPSSETRVETVDVQPVNNSAQQLLVSVGGIVKFAGREGTLFHQHCCLAQEGTLWRIVADQFRIVDESPAAVAAIN